MFPRCGVGRGNGSCEAFDGLGCVGLHAGEDVLVGLHRERDVGVTEAFADDFHGHAFSDEQTPVGVVQIVEADPW